MCCAGATYDVILMSNLNHTNWRLKISSNKIKVKNILRILNYEDKHKKWNVRILFISKMWTTINIDYLLKIKICHAKIIHIWKQQ